MGTMGCHLRRPDKIDPITGEGRKYFFKEDFEDEKKLNKNSDCKRFEPKRFLWWTAEEHPRYCKNCKHSVEYVGECGSGLD